MAMASWKQNGVSHWILRLVNSAPRYLLPLWHEKTRAFTAVAYRCSAGSETEMWQQAFEHDGCETEWRVCYLPPSGQKTAPTLPLPHKKAWLATKLAGYYTSHFHSLKAFKLTSLPSDFRKEKLDVVFFSTNSPHLFQDVYSRYVHTLRNYLSRKENGVITLRRERMDSIYNMYKYLHY